jgi:hypothetical protein
LSIGSILIPRGLSLPNDDNEGIVDVHRNLQLILADPSACNDETRPFFASLDAIHRKVMTTSDQREE